MSNIFAKINATKSKIINKKIWGTILIIIAENINLIFNPSWRKKKTSRKLIIITTIINWIKLIISFLLNNFFNFELFKLSIIKISPKRKIL